MRYLVLAFVLAGCAPAVPSHPAVPFDLDETGVDVPSLGQRIDFGRTQSSTVFAMKKLIGRGPEGERVCGNGAKEIAWAEGPKLYFVQSVFVGWAFEGAAGRTCDRELN